MRYTITTDTRPTKDGSRVVYINFNHFGRRFRVSTGLTTFGYVDSSKFPISDKNHRLKSVQLVRILKEVDEYIAFHHNLPYRTQEQALARIVRGGGQKCRETLADAILEFSKTKENPSTAKVYADTISNIIKFDNPFIDDVDLNWLKDYERWMRQRGQNTNGISKNMRNIRAVFNYLIEEQRIREYPFKKYKVKQEIKPPMYLTREQLITLRDYPCEPAFEKYRDVFMLSFYLCGINLVDLLSQEKLTNGRFEFKRRKTHKPMSLPVIPEAMAIIEKYKGKKHVLRFIEEIKDYHTFSQHANKMLKKIGKVERISAPPRPGFNTVYHPLYPWMTMYTARYTFASLASSIGISREVIALCLGHSWTDVTSRYIVYDQKLIDDAVKRVAESLR